MDKKYQRGLFAFENEGKNKYNVVLTKEVRNGVWVLAIYINRSGGVQYTLLVRPAKVVEILQAGVIGHSACGDPIYLIPSQYGLNALQVMRHASKDFEHTLEKFMENGV